MAKRKSTATTKKPTPLSAAKRSHDWERGYFCAVAVLLKENFADGVSGTESNSLFRQGGDWSKAHPDDIGTFRKHGLIPDANVADQATASE